MPKLSVSILAANMLCIEDELKKVITHPFAAVHLDIMDGHFVDQLSFGHPVVKAFQNWKLRRAEENANHLLVDVHLMVERPERFIEMMGKKNPVDYLSVHWEVAGFDRNLLAKMKGVSKKIGIALNPDTSLDVLSSPFLECIDYILLMSVHPGLSGQAFMDHTYKRLEYLNEIREKKQLSFEIHVDGWISLTNVSKLIKQGASYFVVGSSYFGRDQSGREDFLKHWSQLF